MASIKALTQEETSAIDDDGTWESPKQTLGKKKKKKKVITSEVKISLDDKLKQVSCCICTRMPPTNYSHQVMDIFHKHRSDREYSMEEKQAAVEEVYKERDGLRVRTESRLFVLQND
jgi:hypothetical protein